MTFQIHEVTENASIDTLDPGDLRYLRTKFPQFMAVRRGGWAFVRAVGHVVLPSGCVLKVRSTKAPVHALAAWLAYTDPSLRALNIEQDIDALADEGELSGLLAAIYVQRLVRACAVAGVPRMYQPVRTISPYVRGRIDFPRQLVRGHDASRIHCSPWLRVPDTPLNSFLVAALARARQDPLVSARLGGALAAAARLLAGISPRIDEALLLGRVPLQRHEWPFHAAYRLARMILDGVRLGDGQALPGFAFLLDLERLFEQAVVTAFTRSGRPCTPKWPAIYAARDPDGASRRTMVLDLLSHAGEAPVVVDAKFKHASSAGNLQQMVTYCFLAGAHRACLVLPGHPRDIAAFQFTAPDGRTIVVETHFLPTDATDPAAWERHGAALVERIHPC